MSTVAICKGLAMQKITVKECLIVGAWFGVFQALMGVKTLIEGLLG